MADSFPVWSGWQTVRQIGEGSFGAVYEIERDVFGHVEKAALKHIRIPKEDSEINEMIESGYDMSSVTATFESYLRGIVNEYTLMREVTGAVNIVNCDDFRYSQHTDGIGWDIYIKMELLTPLTKVLERSPSEEKVIAIAKDMCKALVQCRKHDIIHRDIKPQNIFVSNDGFYKLGDFGIARTMSRTVAATHQIGTYNYMAPEVYNNQPYNHTVDIYSLGIVLYCFLNERRHPFVPLPPASIKAGDLQEAFNRRMRGDILPAPAHGSEKLRQIVLKACAFDPRARYQNADEMLKDLDALEEGVPAEAFAPVMAETASEPAVAAGAPTRPIRKAISSKEPEDKEREGKKSGSRKALMIIITAAAVLAVAAVLFAVLLKKDNSDSGVTERVADLTDSIETTAEQETETMSESTTAEVQETTTESETTAEEQIESLLAHFQNLFVVRNQAGGTDDGTLYLRNEDFDGAKIIAQIAPYSGGEVLEESEDWARISSGGITGYVRKKYITTGDEARQMALEHASQYVFVTVDRGLRIRRLASSDSEVIATVPYGAVMTYKGEQDGYYHVGLANGMEGFAIKDFCEYEWYLMGAIPLQGADYPTAEDYESAAFSFGTMTNGVYENEFAGLKVTLSGWDYIDCEKIYQKEIQETESLEAFWESREIVTLGYLDGPSSWPGTILIIAKKPTSQYQSLSDREIVEERMNALAESYKEIDPDLNEEFIKAQIGGSWYEGGSISFVDNGMKVFVKTILIRRRDVYLLVEIHAYQVDTTERILKKVEYMN